MATHHDDETTAPDDGHRFLVPRWTLLPLRLYVGVISLWAGLYKLVEHDFLDVDAPSGMASRLELAKDVSPIGGLLGLIDGIPTAVGIVIAITEITIGLALILGIWGRVFALAGALGQLSIWLTVGWGVDPGFESPNLPYVFALIPFIIAGAGPYNLPELLARRRGARAADADGITGRRDVLGIGATGAALAAGAGVIGGVGRLLVDSPSATAVATEAAGTATTVAGSTSGGAGAGTQVATVAELAAAGGVQFPVPGAASKRGWVTQGADGSPTAFSATCTHQGCTVKYEQSVDQLRCPCHGSKFDAKTGAVVTGPARRPLDPIAITTEGDSITLA